MSKLVGELLSYSKTGIKTAEITTERVFIKPLVEKIIGRETINRKAEIKIEIDKDTAVFAQSELLARAWKYYSQCRSICRKRRTNFNFY